MDTIIINAIKKQKTEKGKTFIEPKQSSIKMYENQIKKLYSKVNNDTNYDINGISKIITNFDVLEKTIFDDNNIKDNTKKNYLNTILNIILYMDLNYNNFKAIKLLKTKQKINSLWEKYIKKIETKLDDNVINDDKYIEPEIIKKKCDELKKLMKDTTDMTLLQEYILILLYCGEYVAPLRNDYASLKIIFNKDDIEPEKNYILNEDGKNTIIIQDDKVSKKQGAITYKLNKSTLLNKKLNILINNRKENNNEYLLLNSKGDKLSKNGLTPLLKNIFNKYFDKKISSSDLRKIYISNLDKDTTNKELKDIAKEMRHSKGIQQGTYKKVKS